MLVYGRSELVEAIVAKSVPVHMVDRVVTDAMVETMATVFEGRSVGQFVNLLKVITQRRVADFWKAKSRHGHEDTTLDETDDEGGRRFDPVDRRTRSERSRHRRSSTPCWSSCPIITAPRWRSRSSTGCRRARSPTR